MLRALVALLLLANLGFWAWSAGALEVIGLAPARERDPSRLAQQVRPEAVRVLTRAEAAAALRAASATLAGGKSPATSLCLEAGPFSPAAAETAERVLATALPAGSWVRTTQDSAAQYAVVLGPFASRDALQKKADELGRLRVTFEETGLPAEDAGPAGAQRGFALGRYDSRAAAEAALAAFSARGVRTARVAALRDASSETRLRIDNANAALAEQARAISAAALGAGFGPCAAAAASR
jgi:hypothetical protein